MINPRHDVVRDARNEREAFGQMGESDAKRFCCDGLCQQGRACPFLWEAPAKKRDYSWFWANLVIAMIFVGFLLWVALTWGSK